MVSCVWRGACSVVLAIRQCFGLEDVNRQEEDRLAVMDVLLHKALSPSSSTPSPPRGNAELHHQRRTKEGSRPASASMLQKALVKLVPKAKPPPPSTMETPEGSYFALPAADSGVLAPPGGILRRNPGLENAVPQAGTSARPPASKTPVRKQLEEALRHYARLQQELVLEQGARTKQGEQVRVLTRENEELRLKVTTLEGTITGLHAGYQSKLLLLENALQESESKRKEGVSQLSEESGLLPGILTAQSEAPGGDAPFRAPASDGPAASDDARALEEARARIQQLEKELHDSLQMALLPPTAPFPACACRVDRLAEEEARCLESAALARITAGEYVDTRFIKNMTEREQEILLVEAIKQGLVLTKRLANRGIKEEAAASWSLSWNRLLCSVSMGLGDPGYVESGTPAVDDGSPAWSHFVLCPADVNARGRALQERMATVVHMKDKFFASEAKRKRAEETVEQYKRRLHDLEQQLHARTAPAAAQQ
ncbi:hypothetical protein KFL_006040040 [Klebsormidium nitens]|uniref:Uncharacterized protein n=1 Tax=Klebsormidium nitens TaxID=105231 RepID=A0A1Y1IJ38_KLENI|nr:hypothetical protein KFL_006040040 [Klebsormidium nitens]|eukprot:GAQ90132.1 hypothetical protein KFL_006040040 [Klebsormidium nitens]